MASQFDTVAQMNVHRRVGNPHAERRRAVRKPDGRWHKTVMTTS
jgi:hypothetical protein